MTYLTGASRSFSHPPDNFKDAPHDRAPVAATALAWREVTQLAAAGNQLAQKVYRLGTAINARKLANAESVPVPTWAQEILAPLEDDDETNVDEALALLSAAL